MSGQDLVTIENYEISTEYIVIFIIEHGVWGPVILWNVTLVPSTYFGKGCLQQSPTFRPFLWELFVWSILVDFSTVLSRICLPLKCCYLETFSSSLRITSVIWRDRESGQMGEKTEKLKFCNLFVLLVLPVHRTRVRRSNLVLGSQLHRCSLVSSNRQKALLPDSSNRRARWRRWQRQRPRRWWPSPHGAWTMLSSSLVFSGIKQKLTMHRQTQHTKQKKEFIY